MLLSKRDSWFEFSYTKQVLALPGLSLRPLGSSHSLMLSAAPGFGPAPAASRGRGALRLLQGSELLRPGLTTQSFSMAGADGDDGGWGARMTNRTPKQRGGGESRGGQAPNPRNHCSKRDAAPTLPTHPAQPLWGAGALKAASVAVERHPSERPPPGPEEGSHSQAPARRTRTAPVTGSWGCHPL